jgi:hypothetical protein
LDCITVTNVSPLDSSPILAYQSVGRLPLRLGGRSRDSSLSDLNKALNIVLQNSARSLFQRKFK